MAPKPTPGMNAFQAAIAQSYSGGDFAYLISMTEWANELPRLGDTLFAFLMLELADGEGCSDRAEALRRLRVASNDIALAIIAVSSVAEPGGGAH